MSYIGEKQKELKEKLYSECGIKVSDNQLKKYLYYFVYTYSPLNLKLEGFKGGIEYANKNIEIFSAFICGARSVKIERTNKKQNNG